MSRWQVIAWWELRRVPFTVVVWLVAVACMLAVGALATSLDPLGIVALLLAYLVFINVAYTLCWGQELGLPKDAAMAARVAAPRTFRKLLLAACALPVGMGALTLAYLTLRQLFDMAFAA